MVNESMNNIRAVKQLTPYSGMSLEIIRIVSNDQADMTDMVAVINKSPAITARILRCINDNLLDMANLIARTKKT